MKAARDCWHEEICFSCTWCLKTSRHHGAYVDEDQINEIVDAWKAQGEPAFDPLAMKAIEGSGVALTFLENQKIHTAKKTKMRSTMSSKLCCISKRGECFAFAKEISAAARAARMIEIFENEGVVGPLRGANPGKFSCATIETWINRPEPSPSACSSLEPMISF